MAISFPTNLDTLTNPSSIDTLNSPSHSDQHTNANDAIEALEAKVGADSSAVTTSHDYKLAHLTASDITDLTASAAELNIMDGVTSTAAELNKLDGTDAVVADFDKLHDITATASELNQLDDVEVGGTATGDIVTIDGTQTLTNKTLTNPNITLTTNTFNGYLIGLADDTASSFTPSHDRLLIFVHSINGAGQYGQAEVWCISGGAVVGTKISGTTTFEVTTGALVGTTGTDGKFTISGHTDGKVYIENRLGVTRTFSLLVVY